MRKFGVIFLATFAASYLVCASDLSENCGCGLGTLVFDGKDTLVLQVFAITSNAPSQAFGISSGTLGCEQPIEIVKSKQLNQFVSSNIDSLAKDVANGSGEYLDTVAELLDVSGSKKMTLYTKLKSNFNSIFQSGKVNHHDVITKIRSVYQTI